MERSHESIFVYEEEEGKREIGWEPSLIEGQCERKSCEAKR